MVLLAIIAAILILFVFREEVLGKQSDMLESVDLMNNSTVTTVENVDESS